MLMIPHYLVVLAAFLCNFSSTLSLLLFQACMLSSSLFHTFLCHSAVVKVAWQELDHACILVAMFGTYVRIIINSFQCFPVVRTAHLSIVSVLFGSVLWLKYKPRTNSSKVSLPMFFTVSLYSVAPFGHWIVLSSSLADNNVDSTVKTIFLLSNLIFSFFAQMISWMFFPFLLGGVGVIFYVSHFPECVVPCGRVDMCGASHQIWHVLIFSGTGQPSHNTHHYHFLQAWPPGTT